MGTAVRAHGATDESGYCFHDGAAPSYTNPNEKTAPAWLVAMLKPFRHDVAVQVELVLSAATYKLSSSRDKNHK